MFADIWESFRRLPVAVQAWVMLVLAPVNLATLLFIDERFGLVIVVLAIAGMLFNMPILAREKGMTKLMALPHLVFWTPLIVLALIVLFSDVPAGYRVFLLVLIVVDVVSLAFDARDLKDWMGGDRAVA